MKIANSPRRGLLLLTFVLVGIASSCAGPKLATDLLVPSTVNGEALRSNSIEISVGIDPQINNYEGLDATVRESLEIALRNANIFGTDTTRPYKIEAHIAIASQATMSFGSFNGKLEIVYTMLDDAGTTVLNETIYTEAGSDRWSFSGAARHRRARAVNISKNVMQFVDILQLKLAQ